MQRQIKFRAWDGKEMHLPQYSDLEDFFIMPDGEVMYTTEDIKTYSSYPITRRRNNWVLMQYTGVYDVTDIEIYEGDICDGGNGEGDYWQVVFVNGAFWFDDGQGNRNTYDWLKDGNYWKHRVIGNIYEHPDLITVPATGNG